APGETVVEMTPTRGMPVSREGSVSAGSYVHQRSRQMSPTTRADNFGNRPRISAVLISSREVPDAEQAMSLDGHRRNRSSRRHRRPFAPESSYEGGSSSQGRS